MYVHCEPSSTFSQGSSMCIQMQFYCPMCSVGILLLTCVTQTGACRLKVSYQLLEVLMKSRKKHNRKGKNEEKGIVTFLSLHLAQQHLFSPLMMHAMLREASYKCLMTLDTTGALKKCCSLNFPPSLLFPSLTLSEQTSRSVSWREPGKP